MIEEPVTVMSRWLDGTSGSAPMALLDDVITYLEMREQADHAAGAGARSASSR